jgi:hypothetical protein
LYAGCFARSVGRVYQSFRLLDVLVPEEELSIEVRKIDSIEVDNMNFAEAGQDEILEQLAAYAAGSDHEHTGLLHGGVQGCAQGLLVESITGCHLWSARNGCALRCRWSWLLMVLLALFLFDLLWLLLLFTLL